MIKSKEITELELAPSKIVRAAFWLLTTLLVSYSQAARAGWSGVMNGTGYGQASVNVRAYQTSLLKKKTVTTPNMDLPNAAIYDGTYTYNAALPDGASPATVAKARGFSGYIWQAETVGSNGDSTDNAELEARVKITAAECASLTLETSAVIDDNNKTGVITVNCTGTAGTAIWLRGYELTDPQFQVPPEDDPNTPENEFIEFLKAHGTLKWDVLNVGPLDQNTGNCSALKIPFSYETITNNLYFVSDGVAKSLPLVIECPNDIAVDCAQPVTYPETVIIGGCGNITVSFNPPPLTNTAGLVVPFPPGSFPVGTNLVTVTATDTNSNTTNCTFKVIVTDTTAPAPDAASLPDVTGQCTATISGPPTATDNCRGTITGTTTDSLTRSTQGMSIVTWKFDDGHGNVSTQTQKIVVTDTTAPAPDAASLPDVTGQCTATISGPPTATDNCRGTITGTTTDSLTRTTQGTSIVTWKFDDGHGNFSTQTQRIVVHDDIPPTIPALAAVTGSCGAAVSVTRPTTTDNCAGTVTGTTGDPLVYSTPGIYTVHWTFSDGNGNSSTANQTVTVAGLTFTGFFSPIGTVSNSCTAPSVVVVNRGSVAPIKFDMFCGTTRITGGTAPTVTIVPVSTADCQPNGEAKTFPAEYQNDWHYNWDTTTWGKATYKVIVNLPDGILKPYVFIKIK